MNATPSQPPTKPIEFKKQELENSVTLHASLAALLPRVRNQIHNGKEMVDFSQNIRSGGNFGY